MRTNWTAYIGETIFELTVIELVPDPKGMKFKCSCSCGKIHIARGSHIINGLTKSCGHFRVENTRKMKTIHGHARVGHVTGTFRAWVSAISRCHDPKCKDWPEWGGRDISVCEEWRNSFQAFLDHMGERPKGRILDRIDNDGNYEPGNCRWATYKQSNNNRRKARPRHIVSSTQGLP